jgi:hypothetical protein
MGWGRLACRGHRLLYFGFRFGVKTRPSVLIPIRQHAFAACQRRFDPSYAFGTRMSPS